MWLSARWGIRRTFASGEGCEQMSPFQLRREQCRIVVVDIQDRLLPSIYEHQDLICQSVKMLHAARILRVPVLVSEQYKKGLGETNRAIGEAAGDAPRMEKMTFSCCGDDAMRRAIGDEGRKHIVLLGIETHVCVLQTALDLSVHGFQPVVAVDAVGSRNRIDRDVALERMRQAGVVLSTVESLIFELTLRSGTPEFKQILQIVR